MAVVPEGRRDRVELSLGGAGGLLRASRATMCWFGGDDPNASPRLVAIAIAILCVKSPRAVTGTRRAEVLCSPE